ncbi:hypothetical protein AB0M28_12020 [Streptomyces sp. NPDC051940]|uniref:hypothetical protein n=1 Tax=Streptomyces sp. NPDC051940 TaxID=3155675 RepID=UPI003427537E
MAPFAVLLVVAYTFLFAIPRAGAWHACGASPFQALVLAGGFESPSLTECAALKWGIER